jgi:hypothetical protein
VLITQAEFARLAGVSRSAVKQAINNGLITEVVEQGGRILINKNEGLQQYQANSRRQRKPIPTAPTSTTTKPATETPLDLLSWGQAPTQRKEQPASSASAPTLSSPGEVPSYNDERALHEREKRLIAQMERKVKAGQLAYIEDMEMAYNAVLLQLTTKAGSLHKQIKAAIPHLTHRELEKIERMVSDVFESVASNAFEELPE